MVLVSYTGKKGSFSIVEDVEYKGMDTDPPRSYFIEKKWPEKRAQSKSSPKHKDAHRVKDIE